MKSDHLQADIVIVGAGMVGALAAVLLADAGFKLIVIEKQLPEKIGPDSISMRVSAITRASQVLLQKAQVWEAIRQMRATPYTHMSVWDGSGSGHIDFDAADMNQPDLGHIIENNIIQAALWQRLQSHAQIQLCCPAEVDTLQLAEQASRLQLSDGRSIQCELLLAADGAQSKIRELAAVNCSSQPYDQHALVTTVQPQQGHAHTAWQKFMPGGPLAFLPIAEDQCSIVWSNSPQQVEQLLQLDDAALGQSLTEAFDARLGKVQVCGPRAAFPLRLQQADHYIAAGLALLGDAAHVIHPLAGQGVNLGFSDVALLLDCVQQSRAAKRPLGAWVELRRYERAARAHNQPVIVAMDAIKKLFSNQQPLLKRLRNSGLNLADKSAFVKHQLIKQAMGLSA
ncbi:MAG: UbiH/UbiF/VisC/COQ6 family ubiquinone biosynthesis hydroxylase [gamma proteobacterium symbiont of Bathyaustriella thionipta]|nr:UbiH/UbiF/VisC/COQ6 family ubiquinone biosynthesis hydroxylase [gamma proteobacterium symbiont of Bathyaustriella thionipta]